MMDISISGREKEFPPVSSVARLALSNFNFSFPLYTVTYYELEEFYQSQGSTSVVSCRTQQAHTT